MFLGFLLKNEKGGGKGGREREREKHAMYRMEVLFFVFGFFFLPISQLWQDFKLLP